MTRSLTQTERAVVDDPPADSGNGGDPVRLAMLGSMALVALQLARFANPAHAVDDAWISFRVARSPLEGHWMLIFGREGLDLDPALWGPAFPRDLRDVLSEAAR